MPELPPPAWMSEDPSEMDSQPFSEPTLLDELYKKLSPPQYQSSPITRPRIRDIRRSPVWLAPEGEQMGPLHTFLPELKCPLEHVTYCSDGRLEFSRRVTTQYRKKAILEILRPGETAGSNGIKPVHKSNSTWRTHGLSGKPNIETLHESLQQAWGEADQASPAPTLEPILVKSRRPSWYPFVWIQYPEAVIATEDLDWANDNGQRLACGQHISARMIGCASLWIDGKHPVLKDLGMLSEKLAAEPALHANGDIDILRNHLRHRRWVWITRKTHTGTVDIDIPRTEAFYDARAEFFNYKNDRLLQTFCAHRHFSQRQLDKMPTTTTDSILGKLEQLIAMSQLAWGKLKANSKEAPVFGPWSDFLVNSACKGNDQITQAIRELDAARHFILYLRLRKTVGNFVCNLKPLMVPELNDLDDANDARHLVEALLWPNEYCEAELSTNQMPAFLEFPALEFLARFRRRKPSQTERQQTGKFLQGVKGFCLRDETECAVILAAKRRQGEWAGSFYFSDCLCSAKCEYDMYVEGEHPFGGRLCTTTYADLALRCSKATASSELRDFESATAAMASDLVVGGSQMTAPGTQKVTASPFAGKTTLVEQTILPIDRNTIQDSPQPSSSTVLDDQDPSHMADPTTEVAFDPTTAPDVGQQSPSGQIESSPETQKTITRASPTKVRWKGDWGSSGLPDSGSQSKLSGESAQPEDRPAARHKVLLSNSIHLPFFSGESSSFSVRRRREAVSGGMECWSNGNRGPLGS